MRNIIIKNYGWAICFGCTLFLFCTGGLATTGFAVYQPYLISMGGLTNTQASSVVMVRTLFSLLGMFATNKLISRFEVRRVVTAGMAVCSFSFLLYGLAGRFLSYCLAAALAGSALGFGGMISASVLISRWFNEHRGMALGFCMAATGLSSVVSSPAITYLVEHFSLQASFFAESAFVLAAAVLVYLILRSRPDCLHTSPIGAHHIASFQTYASHDAPKLPYLFMMTGFLLFGMVSTNTASHLSVLYQTEGFSSHNTSILLSLFGITLAAGKCTYGILSDRLGTFRASQVMYTAAVLGTFLCCQAGSGNYPAAIAAAAVSGFGMAVASVSISMYASRAATEASYAKTVTRFQLLSSLGALLFGAVPGILADHLGTYVPAYAILFILTLFGSVILQASYLIIQRSDLPAKAVKTTNKAA